MVWWRASLIGFLQLGHDNNSNSCFILKAYWLHQCYKKFMELWRFPFNISSQLILWLGSQVLDKWHFHKSTPLFRNCALWCSTTLFRGDLLHEICTIFSLEIIQSILKIYPTSYSYHCNDTFVCSCVREYYYLKARDLPCKFIAIHCELT